MRPCTLARRIAQTELVMEVDEDDFARLGIPCPVVWCTAYSDRFALCGDPLGPFCGVHQGRIKNQRHEATHRRRRAQRRGLDPTSLAAGFDQILRDMVDAGDLPFPGTTRYKRMVAARKHLSVHLPKGKE